MAKKKEAAAFSVERIEFNHADFRLVIESNLTCANARIFAPDGTVVGFSVASSDDRLALVRFLTRAAGSIDELIPAPEDDQ
jgi:hypothetical protein